MTVREQYPPNSPLELDAVLHALAEGRQAAFVPRLRATFAARDAEIGRLRRHLAYLLDRGDALAAAARHCAHACVPPCPHTRKVAAVLETWDATSELSRREGAGAGASRERSDPSPSGPGSLASHDTGGV